MDKTTIISELNNAFQKEELPTIENSELTKEGYSAFDTETNTLICVGRGMTRENNLIDAANYFRVAAIKLSDCNDEKSKKKAEYCKLAENALMEIHDTKVKKGR